MEVATRREAEGISYEAGWCWHIIWLRGEAIKKRD